MSKPADYRSIHDRITSAMIHVNGGMTGGRLGGGDVDERAKELTQALIDNGLMLVEDRCLCMDGSMGTQECRMHGWQNGYSEGFGASTKAGEAIAEDEERRTNRKLKPKALHAAALWASGGENASAVNTLAAADEFLDWLKNS